MLQIPVKCLDNDLPVPTRMRDGDAAADLPARMSCTIAPGARALVPTGFAVAIPQGWFGMILSRSGLALKHGVSVLNAPGIIDSGYRGELQVILMNSGDESFEVERGQRVAQFMVLPVADLNFQVVEELPNSVDDRGEQGFGSSG